MLFLCSRSRASYYLDFRLQRSQIHAASPRWSHTGNLAVLGCNFGSFCSTHQNVVCKLSLLLNPFKLLHQFFTLRLCPRLTPYPKWTSSSWWALSLGSPWHPQTWRSKWAYQFAQPCRSSTGATCAMPRCTSFGKLSTRSSRDPQSIFH